MKNHRKAKFLTVALGICVFSWWGWEIAFPSAALTSVTAEGRDRDVHDHRKHSSSKSEDDLDPRSGEDESAGHADHEGHSDRDDQLRGEGHGEAHDEHAGHDEQERERETHAGHGHDDHADHGHGSEGGECPEHRIPEAEDALCQPQLIEGLHPGEGLKVRLAVLEAAERIGVTASRPLPSDKTGAPLPGEVVFNRNRLARLTPLVSGVVKDVRVQLGDRVEKGQILAEIASPGIAALRSEWIAARSRESLAETVFLREKDLLSKGVTSRQEFESAEAEWRQARNAVTRTHQQLLDYGLERADIQTVKGSSLPVRAPFSAMVAEIDIVEGEGVSQGTPLMTIADLDKLWIDISVPQNRLFDVHTGAKVSATFDGLPGRSFDGTIFWVAPALDEKSRMIKALAEVNNAEGLLRKGLFGEVALPGNADDDALSVPADALQTIDGSPFVFVQLEPDLFEVRRVDAGRRANGSVFIARGLSLEDRVVTAQGFALKSEVLKSRLGASCADH